MANDDSPLGDDEEEILVYVDFEGTAGTNIFCNEKLELDMIGLDSEHPIMQVNGKYYEGSYEDAVGTYMFFEKDTELPLEDEVFTKPSTLKYYTKAKKILKMKRVFVKPRLEVLGDSNHPLSIPNMETIKAAGVPVEYQEKALSFWEAMRTERLDALNEYLEKQRQREEKRQQGIEIESESDDDNPFAMYKPINVQKMNETTSKKNENYNNKSDDTAKEIDLNINTVIDPGPSTSKDSDAWSNSTLNLPDNYQKYKLPLEPKNQGYIKVLATRRSKKDKKKTRKKKIEANDDNKTSESLSSNKLCDITSNNDESIDDVIMLETNADEQLSAAPSNDDKIKNIEITLDQINNDVEMINIEGIQSVTDENSPQISKDILSKDETVDKKSAKQKKREAKMNEISQRLKKSVTEINSKT